MLTTTTIGLSTQLLPTCLKWCITPIIRTVKPSRMVDMGPFSQEWDEELAYMAQFWSSTCRYMENEDRHSQSANFDYVGESFAATISYTVNYTQLISMLW